MRGVCGTTNGCQDEQSAWGLCRSFSNPRVRVSAGGRPQGWRRAPDRDGGSQSRRRAEKTKQHSPLSKPSCPRRYLGLRGVSDALFESNANRTSNTLQVRTAARCSSASWAPCTRAPRSTPEQPLRRDFVAPTPRHLHNPTHGVSRYPAARSARRAAACCSALSPPLKESSSAPLLQEQAPTHPQPHPHLTLHLSPAHTCSFLPSFCFPLLLLLSEQGGDLLEGSLRASSYVVAVAEGPVPEGA